MLGPWLGQLPFNEQKVQFFFAKANEGGTFNAQPFPMLRSRLRGYTYVAEHADWPAVAVTIVVHEQDIMVTFDFLNPMRNGFSGSGPPPAFGPNFFANAEFLAAFEEEIRWGLDGLLAELGALVPDLSWRLKWVCIGMEVNAYYAINQGDYANMKAAIVDIATRLKADYAAQGHNIQFGTYMNLEGLYGLVPPNGIDELADPLLNQLDFLGFSSYPQPPGYKPNLIPADYFDAPGRKVTTQLFIPELGFPSSWRNATENKQRDFVVRLFGELIAALRADGLLKLLCWYVLIDEDLMPIYGRHMPFESMGFFEDYAEGSAKPSWPEWLAGVGGGGDD